MNALVDPFLSRDDLEGLIALYRISVYSKIPDLRKAIEKQVPELCQRHNLHERFNLKGEKGLRIRNFSDLVKAYDARRVSELLKEDPDSLLEILNSTSGTYIPSLILYFLFLTEGEKRYFSIIYSRRMPEDKREKTYNILFARALLRLLPKFNLIKEIWNRESEVSYEKRIYSKEDVTKVLDELWDENKEEVNQLVYLLTKNEGYLDSYPHILRTELLQDVVMGHLVFRRRSPYKTAMRDDILRSISRLTAKGLHQAYRFVKKNWPENTEEFYTDLSRFIAGAGVDVSLLPQNERFLSIYNGAIEQQQEEEDEFEERMQRRRERDRM